VRPGTNPGGPDHAGQAPAPMRQAGGPANDRRTP